MEWKKETIVKADALCDSILAWQHVQREKGQPYDKIDWNAVSSAISSISQQECRSMWKFMAYAQDFSCEADETSDYEEEGYYQPMTAAIQHKRRETPLNMQTEVSTSSDQRGSAVVSVMKQSGDLTSPLLITAPYESYDFRNRLKKFAPQEPSKATSYKKRSIGRSSLTAMLSNLSELRDSTIDATDSNVPTKKKKSD